MLIMRNTCECSRYELPELKTDYRQEARSQAGFTMIEILVSMLLLAIVITGLAGIQVASIRQATASKTTTEAKSLAQQIFEQYRTMPFATLQTMESVGEWTAHLDFSGEAMTRVNARGQRPGNFNVDRFINNGGSGGLLVMIRVTWTDVADGNHEENKYQQRQVLLSMERFL